MPVLSTSNPDSWVPRDPKALIPVTGSFPYNAEPSADKLLDDLVTPNHLHYVRNHGAVPHLEYHTHLLTIDGLVDRPRVWRMDELEDAFDPKSVVVTIACDGNRRKELNVKHPTCGSNFAAGTVSTARWTGVSLRDLLDIAQVQSDAKFVILEGADRLDPHGTYATSIPLSYAMSRYNELLIAYRMNNDIIPPDHGFPLRAIVPGWVGGRQVKWLQRISLSNLPSNNWYHLHDNRVFPPSTLDKSDAERLHGSTDPDTELQELNVNSAIVFPRHNDEIASSSWSSTLSETIMFRGYAYSNGHRIRRVDLTLDDGKNWLTCQRQTLPEDDRFVWCIWSCYIPVYQLIRTKRVRVRAFDSAFNTQPESWTWNLMGMMNNSQYEVRVELISKGNEISLRFLHPVLPGSTRGGFLDDESGIPPQHPSAQLSETVDYATAGKHQTNSDCWIIIDNVVYDVTPFLKDHPGGSAPILALAGRDASAEFHAIHTKDAYILKEKFAIAKIKPGETVKPAIVTSAVQHRLLPDGRRIVLNKNHWVQVTLATKTIITHDTIRFTFRLPDITDCLALPCGKHILLSGTLPDGETVVRPYTPVRPVHQSEEDGTFDLVVKIYFPSNGIPGGKMSFGILNGLKQGDCLRVKGPEGLVRYLGNGQIEANGIPIFVRRLSMIAGGTGITPILQICRHIMITGDSTSIALIFANKTEEDILCRSELDILKNQHKKQFTVWHVIASPKPGWPKGKGFVNDQTLKDHLFPAADDCLAIVCGPPTFLSHAVLPSLYRVGYDEEHIVTM